MGNTGSSGLSAWSTAEQAARNVDLTGKNVIITGANSGIGLETARVLALRGATVFLACRDTTRAEEAANKIRVALPKDQEHRVQNIGLDLGSLDSVRAFAKEFNDKNIPLHILINNAGVMAPPLTRTSDGFELQFGVNHLGHFLLTNLLIDRLRQGAPSRVINLSSMAHTQGKIDFNNINWEQPNTYSEYAAYGRSKLANILFSNEFHRRYYHERITSNSLHPGVIPTELGRNNSFADFFYKAGSLFMKNIAQGASTTVYVATAPELEGVGGQYFADCNISTPSAAALDVETAKKLWEVSEQLVGLVPTPSDQQ